MNKYIDADKLIAEIERLRKNAWASFQKGNSTEEQYYLRYGMIQDIISFIDSLQQEQPEVDLEKALDEYYKIVDWGPSEAIEYDTHKDIARHFYELGLSARKEK